MVWFGAGDFSVAGGRYGRRIGVGSAISSTDLMWLLYNMSQQHQWAGRRGVYSNVLSGTNIRELMRRQS